MVTFLSREAQIRAISGEKLKYVQKYVLDWRVISDLVERSTGFDGLVGELDESIHAIFREILKQGNSNIISVPFAISDESGLSIFIYKARKIENKENLQVCK